jgi:hypothetical protein
MRFGLRDAIFVVIGLAAFPCAPDAQDVGEDPNSAVELGRDFRC